VDRLALSRSGHILLACSDKAIREFAVAGRLARPGAKLSVEADKPEVRRVMVRRSA